MSVPEPGTVRVLCVDDNELIIEALAQRLAQEPVLRWVGAECDGARAGERIRELEPDVVLMDIDMPGIDAFDFVERLAADVPRIRAIMFSGHVNPGYIERALDCGAWGYLSKNEDAASLVEAIKQVARGDIVLSKEVEAVERTARSGEAVRGGNGAAR